MEHMRTAILLLAGCAVFLVLCIDRTIPKYDTDNFCGITRASAARMLHYGCEGHEQLYDTYPLIDVDDSMWYADDIQVVLQTGWMQTDGDLFYPERWLTWYEAECIAERREITLNVPAFCEKKPIPLNEWLNLFDQLIEDNSEISVVTMHIQAIPLSDAGLTNWMVKTDKGIFEAKGIVMEQFAGTQVEVYLAGNQILAVRLSRRRRLL